MCALPAKKYLDHCHEWPLRCLELSFCTCPCSSVGLYVHCMERMVFGTDTLTDVPAVLPCTLTERPILTDILAVPTDILTDILAVPTDILTDILAVPTDILTDILAVPTDILTDILTVCLVY